MFIIRCDRCGKEKEIKSLIPEFRPDPPKQVEQVDMPKYSIMQIGDEIRTISLCKQCEAKFELWLEGEDEDDG